MERIRESERECSITDKLDMYCELCTEAITRVKDEAIRHIEFMNDLIDNREEEIARLKDLLAEHGVRDAD